MILIPHTVRINPTKVIMIQTLILSMGISLDTREEFKRGVSF